MPRFRRKFCRYLLSFTQRCWSYLLFSHACRIRGPRAIRPCPRSLCPPWCAYSVVGAECWWGAYCRGRTIFWARSPSLGFRPRRLRGLGVGLGLLLLLLSLLCCWRLRWRLWSPSWNVNLQPNS